MTTEGRRDPRYRICTEVTIQLGKQTVVLTTRDIGLRGLFVATSEPRNQNEFVRMTLTLPWTGERLVLFGRIAHIKRLGEARSLGIGIELYANARPELDLWESFVRDAARRHPESVEEEVDVRLNPPANAGPRTSPANLLRRVETKVSVDVYPETVEELALMNEKDMTQGRMFLATTLPLPQGHAVSLAIVHPRTRISFYVMGVVRRAVEDQNMRGLSVDLMIDEAARARFRSFVGLLPQGTPPVFPGMPPPAAVRSPVTSG